MPGNITSADAVIMLAITTIFPVPQQLQQFSADNVFGVEAVQTAEVSMGIDGNMAGGFVFTPVPQTFSLMADSLSNDIFEIWYGAQVTNRTIYRASGLVSLPAISRRYTMVNGVLTNAPPMPSAGKVLSPRQYQITWERVVPAPA